MFIKSRWQLGGPQLFTGFQGEASGVTDPIIDPITTIVVDTPPEHAGTYEVSTADYDSGIPIQLKPMVVTLDSDTGTARTYSRSGEYWTWKDATDLIEFVSIWYVGGVPQLDRSNTITLTGAQLKQRVTTQTVASIPVKGTVTAAEVVAQEAAPYELKYMYADAAAGISINSGTWTGLFAIPPSQMTYFTRFNFASKSDYQDIVTIGGGIILSWYQNTGKMRIRIYDSTNALRGEFYTTNAITLGADLTVYVAVDLATASLDFRINGTVPPLTTVTALTSGVGTLRRSAAFAFLTAGTTAANFAEIYVAQGIVPLASITSDILNAGAPVVLVSSQILANADYLGDTARGLNDLTNQGSGGPFTTLSGAFVDVV